MTRIGRDHGVLKSRVGQEPISELVWYEANYRYEMELEAKKK